MADAKGIEAVSQLIEGIKVIAVFGKKVSADGKIGIEDLPALLDLVQKSDVIVKAVQGASGIPAEVKDLSLMEAQELLAKLFDAAKAVQAA